MNKLKRSGLSSGYISEVGVAASLLHWYPLVNDVNDNVTNIHAVNSGVTFTSEGGEFDGGSVIDAQSPDAVFSLYAENGVRWSVSTWFMAYHTDTARAIIGRGGGFGENTTFALYIQNDNTLGVRLRGGMVKTHPIILNEWNMATVTWDGSTAKLYVQGVYQGVVDVGSAPLQSNERLYIGAITANATYPFKGKMRDARFYGKALTSKEVSLSHVVTNTNNEQKIIQAYNSLYTKGQFKEVIC